MSKMMNEIYAEARAAREKAANDRQPRSQITTEGSAPEQSLPSSVEWWKSRYELAGRAAVSDVTFTAIKAITHPCSPPDHIAWWARTYKCQPWDLL